MSLRGVRFYEQYKAGQDKRSRRNVWLDDWQSAIDRPDVQLIIPKYPDKKKNLIHKVLHADLSHLDQWLWQSHLNTMIRLVWRPWGPCSVSVLYCALAFYLFISPVKHHPADIGCWTNVGLTLVKNTVTTTLIHNVLCLLCRNRLNVGLIQWSNINPTLVNVSCFIIGFLEKCER